MAALSVIFLVFVNVQRVFSACAPPTGFNPRWDCTLSFQLQVPELALVRFVVEDHDHTAKNDFVGQFTLPFTSLRTGEKLSASRRCQIHTAMCVPSSQGTDTFIC